MGNRETAEIWQKIPDLAHTRVTKWRELAAGVAVSGGADLLDMTQREDGAEYVSALLRLIASSDDALLAALDLRQIADNLPQQVARSEKLAVIASSIAAVGLPWLVVPAMKKIAQLRFADMICVTELITETGDPLPNPLKRLLASDLGGDATAILPLGTPVLGPETAHRERRRLTALASAQEIKYLTVDVARLAPADSWAYTARIQRAVSALRQIITVANQSDTFVTLHAGGHEDALFAADLAMRLITDKELLGKHFGLSVRAESGQSLQLLERFVELADKQVAAALKRGTSESELPRYELRIITESAAAAESLRSLQRNQQVPVIVGRQRVEAAALQLLERLQKHSGVRAVVVTDSAYLAAAALEIAPGCVIETRRGLTPELSYALQQTGCATRQLAPIVTAAEYRAAVADLIQLVTAAADNNTALARRNVLKDSALAAPELAAAELVNMQTVCELASADQIAAPDTQQRQVKPGDKPITLDTGVFYHPTTVVRQTEGLTAAVLSLQKDNLTGALTAAHVAAERRVPIVSESGFIAEPDTDITNPDNRQWLKKQVAAGRDSGSAKKSRTKAGTLAADELAQAAAEQSAPLEQAAKQAKLAGRAQASGDADVAARRAIRVRALRQSGLLLAASRDTVTRVLAAITSGNANTVDSEASRLIDSARYLAQQAASLDAMRGATVRPRGAVLLVLEAPQFFADFMCALLAEYASGNTVTAVIPEHISAPLHELLQIFETAGVREMIRREVTAVDFGQLRDIASRLVLKHDFSHAKVFGSAELGRKLLSSNAALELQQRGAQLGTLIVTPSADYDQAIQGIIESAFTDADNGLRRVRAVIAVGSVYRSRYFRAQLADAVRAIAATAANAADPLQPVGTPYLPSGGDELGVSGSPELLPDLQAGESYLVTPRALSEVGEGFYTPGVRLGCRVESDFWEAAPQLPVIGLVPAKSLQHALELSNELGAGAVAGLYSWDAAEVLPWLDNAHAASLTVNCPTVPGRVEQLASGIWGANAGETAVLAGGPHEILPLNDWLPRAGTPSSTLHLQGLDPQIQALIEFAQQYLSYEQFDRLRRAALTDALTWRTRLAPVRDLLRVETQHAILRYWPVSTLLRVAADAVLEDFLRVLCAGLLVGAQLRVSTGLVLPDAVERVLYVQGVPLVFESEEQWLENTVSSGALDFERIRLVGGDPRRLREWFADNSAVGVYAQPVTLAGPVELLAFLREQSVLIANYRGNYLTPLPEVAEWLRQLGR